MEKLKVVSKKAVYYLKEKLGEGGFGTVFDAVAENGAKIAVKFLHADLQNPEVERRFEREVRIMKGISHPSIVPILDSGVDESGRLWYAMPKMPGGSLADSLNRKRPLKTILHLMEKVGSGLAAYHAASGYHRDLKPENILLDADGRPLIADFGVARCPELTGSSLTCSTQGTPGYMAPEVWDGQAGAHSDIYSLGIVLWELVNRKRYRKPASPPKKLGSRNRQLDLLFKGMTSEVPEERPSAKTVVQECQLIVRGIERAQEVAKANRPKSRRRASTAQAGSALVTGLLIALFTGLIGGAFWLIWQAFKPMKPKPAGRR